MESQQTPLHTIGTHASLTHRIFKPSKTSSEPGYRNHWIPFNSLWYRNTYNYFKCHSDHRISIDTESKRISFKQPRYLFRPLPMQILKILTTEQMLKQKLNVTIYSSCFLVWSKNYVYLGDWVCSLQENRFWSSSRSKCLWARHWVDWINIVDRWSTRIPPALSAKFEWPVWPWPLVHSPLMSYIYYLCNSSGSKNLKCDCLHLVIQSFLIGEITSNIAKRCRSFVS